MRKAAAVLLFLTAFLTTLTNAQPRDVRSLRVMTFNIRYNEPRDKENAWPNRKEKAAGVIRFHKADLVGVQEALVGQLKDLEALLPDFAWCGVGRDDGRDKARFSAILTARAALSSSIRRPPGFRKRRWLPAARGGAPITPG